MASVRGNVPCPTPRRRSMPGRGPGTARPGAIWCARTCDSEPADGGRSSRSYSERQLVPLGSRLPSGQPHAERFGFVPAIAVFLYAAKDRA